MFPSISFNQAFSYQLPVFIYDHLQARLVLNWFVSGSQGNNTAQIEPKQGDSFTAGVLHRPSCHLVFTSVPGRAWLSACFSIFLLIFLSQCLQIFQLLTILTNFWTPAMFCSLVFISSWLLLAPRPDILLS